MGSSEASVAVNEKTRSVTKACNVFPRGFGAQRMILATPIVPSAAQSWLVDTPTIKHGVRPCYRHPGESATLDRPGTIEFRLGTRDSN